MDSCPPHNFNGYGVCDCGARNHLADSPESNSTDNQFSISGPARTINEGWFCYSGHCHNTQEGAVKCGEETIVSVDDQFNQAVERAGLALMQISPRASHEDCTKEVLDAVHFRDYLELAEELRKYQALENGPDTLGLAGLSWQYIETILARIDAHATEAT